MSDIIITSGRKYIDIDAYASMIAYRELLKVISDNNIIASTTAILNQSVPPLILNLRYSLDRSTDNENNEYILLDVSNPDFFDKQVKSSKIVEIIDHHTGFEQYWAKYPNIKTQIEFIGSVCTLVYEKIIQSRHVEILDTDLCKLLVAGILDNTLNLKTSITTDRDRSAYNELLRLGKVPEDFYKEYFSACEAEITKDFEKAIKDDLKIEKAGTLPEVIGQMIVLNLDNFDQEKMNEIFAAYPEWMMNVILLEEGKSYIYFGGDSIRQRLEHLFDKKCGSDNLLVLDKFLLRKQIMKKARDAVSI
ncbi:DHH family phosphoesterase [Candidatus Saccharibacteria bacterium]|nr:DHH family phosphoesterase [Candidatus Saccharibacteria bacterium]